MEYKTHITEYVLSMYKIKGRGACGEISPDLLGLRTECGLRTSCALFLHSRILTEKKRRPPNSLLIPIDSTYTLPRDTDYPSRNEKEAPGCLILARYTFSVY